MAGILLIGLSFFSGSLPSKIRSRDLGSAICLVSHIKVIKSFNPEIASTFAYVNPLIGVAMGWTLLGELPETTACLGTALILFGVFLVLARPSKRSAAYASRSINTALSKAVPIHDARSWAEISCKRWP